MNMLMSGSHGFIGSFLVKRLQHQGHQVLPIERSGNGFRLDPKVFEGVDVVIHLAGPNVTQKRWTKERKKLLRDARVEGTRHLSEFLAGLTHRPRLFLSASAIGFYGDRGDEILTEESASGDSFLSAVAEDWERSTQPARDAGIRVVNLRIGIVLAPHGGALARMLPAFRLGLGGRLGSGEQWMSWIALEDLTRIIQFSIEREDLSGPVNAVAPHPITNARFTKLLAQKLHRPAFFHLPAKLLRLLMGEMADEILLASARVEPSKLLKHRFEWKFPEFEGVKVV